MGFSAKALVYDVHRLIGVQCDSCLVGDTLDKNIVQYCIL